MIIVITIIIVVWIKGAQLHILNLWVFFTISIYLRYLYVIYVESDVSHNPTKKTSNKFKIKEYFANSMRIQYELADGLSICFRSNSNRGIR